MYVTMFVKNIGNIIIILGNKSRLSEAVHTGLYRLLLLVCVCVCPHVSPNYVDIHTRVTNISPKKSYQHVDVFLSAWTHHYILICCTVEGQGG